MLPTESTIGAGGCAASPQGLRVDMRLPWYRSLPVSTTQVDALVIDGAPVDLSAAHIEVAGESLTLAQAADAVDTFWFVLDSAFLVVPGLDLPVGSQHEVSLTLNVFPPYIPGMKRVMKQTENLTVGEAA